MIRRLRILFLFVVVASTFLAQPRAVAQVPAGLDTETGVWPFRSYEGGNIDSLDLATGKLTVNIPLVSYPQRGRLKFGYSLLYTNIGTYFAGCFPSAFSSGQCALIFPFQSGFTPVTGGVPLASLDCEPKPFVSIQSILDPSNFTIGSVDVIQSTPPSPPGGLTTATVSLNYRCSASVSEADGAGHNMAAIGPTTWMATDASGYRLDLLPGSNIASISSGTQSSAGSPPPHIGYVLTDRDGTQYAPHFFDGNLASGVVSEDTNGNQITRNGSTITDTVGRILPGMPCFPSGGLPGPYPSGLCGATTDYSGCTGPLPIAGAAVWNPPGVDGGTYNIKFCFVVVSEVNPGGTIINFLSTGGSSQSQTITIAPLPTTAIQLQSVVLPNQTAWTFTYTTDGFGNLSQITLPTGGTINYTWGDLNAALIQASGLDPFQAIVPQVITSRTVSPNDGTSPSGQWTYHYLRPAFGSPSEPVGPWETVVTDPAQNDTVHTFNFLGITGDPTRPVPQIYETLTQFYQGSYTSGQVLKTIQTDYKRIAGNQWPSISTTVVPIRHTTTLDNGLQSKVEEDWDAGFPLQPADYDINGNSIGSSECAGLNQLGPNLACGNALYGTVEKTREYDYGSGSPGVLIRTTSTPHLALSSPSYLNNNLLNLAAGSTITDSGNNVVASASFGYDETALNQSGISTQHDPTPPAGQFRGNLTSANHVVTTPANSCNNNTASTTTLTSSTTWFDTGEVSKHLDPLKNPTTFSYSSTYAGAFPTGVCNALNQCSTATYDLSFGMKTSVTDANNQVTSYSYDSMGRLKQVIQPAQVVNGSGIAGGTVVTYNDTPGSLSIQYTSQQDANSSITALKFFDGLARPSATQLNDPEGNVITKTTYDSFGRVNNVTNPYRSTSDPTYGSTQTQYDALGRPFQTTHPDGSISITSYTGRAVEMQDEGNGTSRVTRISQADALGRLTSVCEVTNATQANQNTPSACGQDITRTGFLTSYFYNTLGDLTGVTQSNLNRSFVYDTGSRLVNAANPESGTTCYQYDGNGNVLARTRPAPNQSNPNNTVTTSYNYDPLNRLTHVSYSDSVTPSISLHYDTTQELGVPLNNTVGRLSAEYAISSSGQVLSGTVYSYDPLGHVIDNSQCTPQNCSSSTAFPVQYSYDLLGKTLRGSNGAGTTFSYGYDGAGRLTQVTSNLSDAAHPGTLFSGPTYNAFGALTAASLGSALSEATKFDCRGRPLAYASAVFPGPVSLSANNTPGCPSAVAMDQMQIHTRFLPSLAGSNSRRLLPLRSVGSVLISGIDLQNESERGSLTVKISPLGANERSVTVTVPYTNRDTALSLAQKCADQINHHTGLKIKTTLKQLGSAVVIDLLDYQATADPGFFVSAAVNSNLSIPSFSATSSGASRKLPVLLTELRGPAGVRQ